MLFPIFQDLYKYLSKNCGKKIDTYLYAGFIKDSWISEISSGLKLPEWVTPEISNQMADLLYFCFTTFSGSKRILRFRLGIYYNEFFKRIYEISTGKKETKKAYFLSTVSMIIIHHIGDNH